MTGYEIKEQEERVILVGIALSENDLTDESLDELAELARTGKNPSDHVCREGKAGRIEGTHLGAGGDGNHL